MRPEPARHKTHYYTLKQPGAKNDMINKDNRLIGFYLIYKRD